MRSITRGVLTAATSVALLASGAGAAFADDCVNLSRNASPDRALHGGKVFTVPGEDGFTTVTKGHWVYVGDTWLFITPGTTSLDGIDVSSLPGSSGNYTNGQADDLLGVAGQHSAGLCTTRQQSHGIQSGACEAAGG